MNNEDIKKWSKRWYIESTLKYFLSIYFIADFGAFIERLLTGNTVIFENEQLNIAFEYFSLFLGEVIFTIIIVSFSKLVEIKLDDGIDSLTFIEKKLQNIKIKTECENEKLIFYENNIQKFYYGKGIIYKKGNDYYMLAAKPLVNRVIRKI